MDRSEQAQFKRCMEYYCADPDFRSLMDIDPGKAAASAGLERLNARSALQAIRGIVFHKGDSEALRDNPYVRASAEHEKRAADYLAGFRRPTGRASDKVLRFERNTLERCRIESSLIRRNSHVMFVPFAFELSKGCSVQCPFCGFAAERHRADFLYSEENAALFRKIILLANEYAGGTAAHCPLYFATEPFDNPDYEKFMLDFREITGAFPQTTTAVAERFPGRMRRWMEQVGSEDILEHAALRFSIRTLSQFRKIAAIYSPEELLGVELLPNNPESVLLCSASGHAAERKACTVSRNAMRYSICCVAGMKVNLVDRTVEFIEPELPDDRYPLGYSVRERRGFSGAEEFAGILRDFDRRYVHDSMPRSLPLRFNHSADFSAEGDEWRFTGDGCGYRIGKNIFTTAVVEGIKAHRSFTDNLALFSLTAENVQKLYEAFNELYVRGYIRSE